MRVILIGGSSHTGKSTTAQALASKLGCSTRTTDHIARHPGRPWKTKLRDIPPHVDEHYSTLPTAELFIDVLKHYYRLWPEIKSIITAHATDSATDPLVLEGSALWPENVVTLDLENVKAIWLTASDELFQKRMYAESHYAGASPHEKMLIDKFLDRTILYNQKMMAAVRDLGLKSLEVMESDTPDELANRVLELLEAN